MSDSELLNPITLAAQEARLLSSLYSSGTETDEAVIINNLDARAGELGFLGCYYEVEAARMWSVSLESMTNGTREDATQFFDQRFTGELWGYSKASSAEDRAEDNFDALCLTFYDVTLLPSHETVPMDEALTVPVLGVGRIELLQ
jgi:hypothetical protein